MLVVGVVRRPHGLQGEVSVQVVTDFPERFVPGSALSWRDGSRTRSLKLSGVRWNRERLLLSFEGIGDAHAAAELAGGELSVSVSEAVPAPPGFYYSHEVEGWRCEDGQGKRIGVVTRLEKTPAGPLLSIETADRREALVPFVRPIVIEVDRDARRVVLELPEGLLDL